MYRKIIVAITLMAGYLNNFAQDADTTNSHSINEITVHAYRTNSELGKIPRQLKVIGNEEITSLPGNALDDLLKKSAGIDILQYPGFSSTVSMRGFAPIGSGNNYTLIMVNGIPVGTENISTLNLDNASQVEVLKGPFSSFFGSNAMGGIINIAENRSKDQIWGKASFAYGSFNTYKIATNLGGKISSIVNFDFFASTRAQNDNYKTGSNNLLELTDYEKLIMDEKSYGKEYKNTKYKQYSVGGRLGFQINEYWEVNLNQDIWLAKDIQTNGTFWGSYGPTGKDIDRWSQSMSVEGKLSNHELRLTPHYSIENTNFYNDVSADKFQISNYNFKSYGAILQDAFSIGNHRIIFGVDNLSKKHESKQWDNPENPSSPYQPDYLNMSTGVYLQANFNLLNDKLNTSVGGRYDNIIFKIFETELIESSDATEQYNVFNPNIGIQYQFLKGFKLHTAAGTAFVAPDAFKVAGNFATGGLYATNYKGNPDLQPETSVTYDFGLAYENKKIGLSADITYFTTSYNDMVVLDFANPEYTTYTNADKANMDGLELNLFYDFGALNNYAYSLKFYMDYTHLYNANITKEGITESTKVQMKYVRMNKASFGIIYDNFKGFLARVNARYIGERDEDNWLYTLDWNTYERLPYQTADGQDIRPDLIQEDVLKHPDYLIIDLSASYTFKEKYGLGLKIDNLLDDNYMEKDTYYMPGRSIMGSIFVKF